MPDQIPQPEPRPQAMADSMPYPTASHYLPHPHPYYPSHQPSAMNHGHGHVHVVSPPPRPDTTQRKRPKYTRSKTGCLTCRVKKIKCDETKPNCMRCTHGQRDCTWPEGVPPRKKAVARKDSSDTRPSTAGSSGLSESSTPPTRDNTPPRRPTDAGLLPLPSRRTSSDSYLQLPIPSDADLGRRHLNVDRSPYPSPSSNVLTMIPESVSYPSHPRYDNFTSTHPASSARHAMATGYRTLGQPLNQWNPSESLDPYLVPNYTR
ncbi:hypothetical protein BDN72DRAFT_841453 [Pluteus cervinus]|uniref:Uncharacterized protein n=1 Tax=Pluteus cervinus TaxID=181527 RepID=A0ACD3AT31_9AGAR|nr:hypothetical protein BDN72DRAFT_841453 [Pluteus cervinus]